MEFFERSKTEPSAVYEKDVEADADILPYDLMVPGYGRLLRVGVAVSSSTTFKLKLVYGWPNLSTEVLLYNSGMSLYPNALYVFDWPIGPRDYSVNFRLGSSAKVRVLVAYFMRFP